MFFKHLGRQTKTEAKRMCSEHGKSFHLPIPRFPEENEFYRTLFSEKGLWLDVYYSRKTDQYKSFHGHLFSSIVRTMAGVVQIDKYDWIDLKDSIDILFPPF